MPNGGSDCCGTCPYNRKNRGQAGYGGRDNPEPDHCEIRDLPITGAPFWTYCANHPHHNPDGVRIPIGPVYTNDGDGFPYGRKLWQPSPDTEEVRAGVLRVIATATADRTDEHFRREYLVRVAIRQAGEFRDLRYIPDLDRVRALDPTRDPDDDPDGPVEHRTVTSAVQSLEAILPAAEVRPFVTATVRAVAEGIDRSGDTSGLPALADALQEAGCTHGPTLEYLCSPESATAAVQNPCWVIDVILGRTPASAAPSGES